MTWFAMWPPEGGAGLDPKVREALEEQGPTPDFRSLPLADLRANFRRDAALVPKLLEPLAGVEDRTIEGPGGPLSVRIYAPDERPPFPVLLYFHGGGWVVGDLDTHDGVCRSLARRAEAVVVAVDYRRAPETPFPGPLEDALAALRWLSRNAPALGGDPARVAVGGDSAGANLAAALALRVRDEGGPPIRLQLLVYPVTDSDFETATYREFAEGYGLTRANMRWFWDCYVPAPAARSHPYAAPLRAPDLRGLPPALVLTAEFDVLRDEGEAYARRLHEAEVPVRCLRFCGLTHGFIRMGAVYPQADHALTVLARACEKQAV
jgi:acetyl esterase